MGLFFLYIVYMGRKSTTPFTYYTFRFDIDWQDENNNSFLSKLKNYIMATFSKYAIFSEISDKTKKPHLQGKIGQALGLERIRELLKKQFPGVFHDTNYSMSLVDHPEKYDSYICKSNNIFCNNVFTLSEIQQYNDTYSEVKEELKSKYETGKKQSKSKTFLENVVREFSELHPSDVERIHHYTIYIPSMDIEIEQFRDSKQILFRFLLKRLGKLAKVFDVNILQRMYNGILNSVIHLSEHAGDYHADRLMDSIQL